ncbi:DNA-binding protein [Klebsiella sp. 10982]|jgi:hypothetical protein|uniref:hypothetical protein n=1 Tax=Klebsiella TaxID=570 RepID=UPI00066601AD|nr:MULTISPECIES: hypothetical protein [Klebsiella]QLT68229.1 DNA-binding protein [Klebsiella oxytoca]DAL48411.1 MAG TPA_asm: Homeodomain-like domain [Caudoviricetes sp.]HDU3818624.1 DNA-binding protein [Klebsiella pneumoniae subsp. pneumoniae]MDK1919804.1 DNA-binding protein [Klebsiella sp. K4-74]MDN4857996.1 DNA-binding protein [Klebsiella pneumoniae]
MSTEVKKKLTPAQWVEVEVKWKSGEYTLSALEEEYGLRTETFSRYFKKKGISKGSDSVSDMIRESLKSDSEQRALARAKLVEDRRDSFDKISNQIAGLTMKEIHAARSESRPLSVIEDNLKSLQRASAIIGKCFDISSRALGLEREEMAGDEIPNLVFGELTPTQVQELRKMDEGNSLSDDLEELEELEKSLGAIPDEDDESEDDEEGEE